MFLPSLALAKEIEMKKYNYKITRILDGDTVGFEAAFLPDPLKKNYSFGFMVLIHQKKAIEHNVLKKQRKASQQHNSQLTLLTKPRK